MASSDVKERDHGIDLIKTIAIILIIIVHFQLFVTIGQVSGFSTFMMSMGIGMFVFASGYLIKTHHPIVNGKSDALVFYRRRLLRLYPLYFVVLMVAFIILPALFVPSKVILAYILGLQMLPGTHMWQNFFWFVGLILILTAMYPLIVRDNDPKRTFLRSSMLIVPFLIVTAITGLVDARLYIYYPVFIAGIILVMFKDHIKGPKAALPASLMIAVIAIVFLFLAGLDEGVPLSDPVGFAICYGAYTAAIAGFGMTLLMALDRVPLERLSAPLRIVSDGSYAIYLTHFIILNLISNYLHSIGTTSGTYDVVMVATVLLVIPFGVIVTALEGKLRKGSSGRKRTVKDSH